jgi:hypothetical protein
MFLILIRKGVLVDKYPLRIYMSQKPAIRIGRQDYQNHRS